MMKTKSTRTRNPRSIGRKSLREGLLEFDSRQMELELGEEWKKTPPAGPSEISPQNEEKE